MRVLVTGATGHLGAACTRSLLTSGFEVACVVRSDSDTWRLVDVLNRVHLIYAEMPDWAGLPEGLADWIPDAAVHLAWWGVTATERNSADQVRVNLVGTVTLLDILGSVGCKCFVGLGSVAEYGPHDGAMREDLRERPVTAYGAAKLAAGVATSKMAELFGMRHVWLRLVTAYGPCDDEYHLIPSIANALLSGRVPEITAGEQLWDYVYVDDVAEAILAVIECGVSGTFVLGSGVPVAVHDIAFMVRDLIDSKAEIGLGRLPYRNDQVMRLEADITKLSSATGWKPRVPLEEGLRRTVDYYRSHQNKHMSHHSSPNIMASKTRNEARTCDE